MNDNNQFRQIREKEMNNYKKTTEEYLKNINTKLNKKVVPDTK